MEVLSKDDIQQAIKYLRQGKIGVFSSETSYGLGCDATNQQAVDNIYAIKKRSRVKSLLVVVPTVEMAKKYLVWNNIIEKLAGLYWPGPLTIVGKSKNNLAKGVISSEDTVAIRVTNHLVLKQIAIAVNKPIVATSANLSDQGDIYSAEQIQEIFSGQECAPDFLLDFGQIPKTKPTTIVSVIDGISVLRQGEIKINI